MSVDTAARQRATSWDVAKRAGPSRSAVSQILNGHGDRFLEETRDRVLAAADELGYRPSRAGRALVNGVTDLVVVVLPNTTFGTSLQDMLDLISSIAAKAGLSVFVRFAGNDPAATLSAILDLRPAAVVDFDVFQEKERKQIMAAGIDLAPKTPGSATEDINVLIGGLQAAELLRFPERRLVYALLADERLDPFGPQRLKGATAEAGRVGLQPPTVIRVPLDLRGAVAALSAVATDTNTPLGICCYNDDVAVALLSAAREVSLAVPETVAIVGVDRTDIGQLIAPRLTTIALDIHALTPALISGLEILRSTPASTEAAEPRDLAQFITLVAGESS